MNIFTLMGTILVDNTAANNSISSTSEIADTMAGKVSTGLSKIGSFCNSVGETMANVGSSLVGKVTAPLIAFGTAATTVALSTEEAMAKVNSILQLGGSEWDAYESNLKQGANDIKLSYEDYADAAYQAISASVEQTKVTEFLTDANKLAKGGMTDLTTSTDLLTTIMNAYGKSADEASNISDVLINTQNKGKTTVNELASSMGKIIPTAKSQNVSLEQLGAGYSILTAKGIATAESTTYMNAMLNELGKGGTKVDGILREVAGGSFADMQASGKTVGDVLELLSVHAKENGKSFSDLWSSSEAGKAALVLLGDGADQFNEALQGMTDCAGSANSAFETMNSTTKGKLTQSLTLMKNTLSDVGEALAPYVEKMAEVIAKSAEWLQNINQTNPGLIDMGVKIGLVAAAIGPLLLVGGKLISGIGTLCTIISTVVGWFTVGASGVSAFGAGMAVITGPIGIAVAAVTALVGAVIYLYNTNEDVRNAINECWEAITECFNSALTYIKGVVETFIAVFNEIWNKYGDDIKEVIDATWKTIAAIIQTAVDLIKNIFNVFSKAFQGDWEGCWEAVKKLASDLWNDIGKSLAAWLDLMVISIVNIGHAMLEAGKEIFTFLWDGIKDVWSHITSWIEEVKNNPVDTIKNIGHSMFEAGREIFTFLWDGIKDVWNNIQSWVGEKVDWIVSKVAFWRSSEEDMSSSSVDGSHRSGLNYVPFDGYVAELHRGERVLTANEAERYDTSVTQTTVSTVDTSKLETLTERLIRAVDNIPKQMLINSNMA